MAEFDPDWLFLVGAKLLHLVAAEFENEHDTTFLNVAEFEFALKNSAVCLQ